LEGIPAARQQEHKKAAIYEVWDKTDKRVYWLAKGMDIALDERDDPLKLDEFFPCPKPLFATISTNSLVPVPDFAQYQDQAYELDNVTNRIGQLVDAVKVVGVYDASQDGLKRLMSEGVNNTLIPVNNWAMFGEKGGLKGVIDFLPLTDVVNALQNLYLARDQIKQVIYEITGIADILRGQSNANETATAQQIKSNYAGLRVRARQAEVARFARDIIRLKAEIICEFFSDETIINMSGAQFLSEEDQQYVTQALQLLRDDVNRNFRVDIESDSMVEADEKAEKEAADQLLVGFSTYMEKAVAAATQAPQIAPLMLEVGMFALRRNKVGKTIEGQFQETFDSIMQSLKQPKPDPEQAKMQAEQQAEQMRMQIEQANQQARMQADMAIQQARAEADMMIERQRMEMQAQIDRERMEYEGRIKTVQARADALTKLAMKRIDAETQITTAQISADATLTAAQETAADKAVDGE
jgi:hypothetical protein